MMTNSPLKRLALLIDADNAQRSCIEHVLKFSQKKGQVEIRRAYGDWKKPPLSPWREKIDALGIECVQVNQAGKNATDHGMLIDAGVILGSNPDIGVFVIVSGDGDFASACEMIKQKGKQVIGIGNKDQASTSLKKSCDHFYNLEDLEGLLSKPNKPYPIPPSELQAFFIPLTHAYHRLTESYDWVSYSELGAKLREIVPDFENRFGSYRLSTWVKSFDQDFESRVDRVRRIDRQVEETRLNLLIKAYEQTRGQDETVHLTQLGSALRALDSDYKRHFGSKQLSKWLRAYPNVFTIQDGHYVGRTQGQDPRLDHFG